MAGSNTKGCALALFGGCLLALLLAGGAAVILATGIRKASHRHEVRHHLERSLPAAKHVSEEDQATFRNVLELQGEEGHAALSALIEDHPDCYNLYYERARLARSMGHLRGALGDFSFGTALQLGGDGAYFPWDDSDVPPPPFVALLDLAEVHAELGNVDAAIDTARSSLDEDPEHPYRPLVYIGRQQCTLGRFEEALPNFERALDCDDPWVQSEVRVDALAGKARALYGLGRSEEALEAYVLARIADWRAVDPELHFDMALVQLDAGDLAGAERSLHHAREIDPANELVEEALRRTGAALDSERRRTRDF